MQLIHTTLPTFKRENERERERDYVPTCVSFFIHFPTLVALTDRQLDVFTVWDWRFLLTLKDYQTIFF